MSGFDIFAWIVLIILVASIIAVFCIAGWLPGHIQTGPASIGCTVNSTPRWRNLSNSFLRSSTLKDAAGIPSFPSADLNGPAAGGLTRLKEEFGSFRCLL